MDRIVRGLAATISVTVEIAGVPTDPAPDEATVSVVRADGSEAIGERPAAAGDNGLFTTNLTPVDTALLDFLTAYWTVTVDGIEQTVATQVEIVGGLYFTIGQAREPEWAPLDNADIYTAERIAAARTDAERDIEEPAACGRAFVARYQHERLRIRDGLVELTRPHLRRLRSVTVNDVALTTEQVATLAYSASGVVRVSGYGSGWAQVGYEHGKDRPPAMLRDAAIELVRHRLEPASVDGRVSYMSTDDGAYRYTLPGREGLFGLPKVDAAVIACQHPGALV